MPICRAYTSRNPKVSRFKVEILISGSKSILHSHHFFPNFRRLEFQPVFCCFQLFRFLKSVVLFEEMLVIGRDFMMIKNLPLKFSNCWSWIFERLFLNSWHHCLSFLFFLSWTVDNECQQHCVLILKEIQSLIRFHNWQSLFIVEGITVHCRLKTKTTDRLLVLENTS